MTTSRVEKDAAAQGVGGLSQRIPVSSTKSPLSAKNIRHGPHDPTQIATQAAATTTKTAAVAPTPSDSTVSRHASETSANPTPKIPPSSSSTPNPHSPPSRSSPSSSSSSPPNPATNPAASNLTSKIAHLQTQITTLERELSTTHAQLESKLTSKTKISHPAPAPDPDPASAAETIVKRHIKLLHDYNEIKDVGLGLMGLIADARDVRLGPVMDEFGVDAKD
jgi:DNA repair protein Swi5/Sae3